MHSLIRILVVATATTLAVTAPLGAQSIPENARAVSFGKGWVCNTGFAERGQTCVSLGVATDAEIRQYLINQSIAAYSGSCPCPYNVDRAGRRCGGRSAHSRPGGRAPLCFAADISDERVKEVRSQHAPRDGSGQSPRPGGRQ